MKRILILFAFLLVTLPFSFTQSYNIKNRLNAKLSLSFNRTNYANIPVVEFDNIPPHPIQAKLNMRAECNYGVFDWLELGGYLGYMRYVSPPYTYERVIKGYKGRTAPHLFAPTFGVNINIHILPFLNVKKNCRWEWYVTAKYGGAYLRRNIEFWSSSFITNSDGTTQYLEIHCLPNRYRRIFGAGIGGGVYFWNLVGLYTEVMGGQYSYFPEICNSYWTARVGIEFKFMTKKKKQKETETQPQHIEVE